MILAEEEVLAFWIQGIHDISIKKLRKFSLALPKKSPSPRQANARPLGSIASNKL